MKITICIYKKEIKKQIAKLSPKLILTSKTFYTFTEKLRITIINEDHQKDVIYKERN